jgi:hypothetical protein
MMDGWGWDGEWWMEDRVEIEDGERALCRVRAVEEESALCHVRR